MEACQSFQLVDNPKFAVLDGEMIGPYDILIASQAISKDLVFVTNNEKE